MAFFDTAFSVDELPVGNSYELLPAGWYEATIDTCSLETTKAGNGQYIKLRWKINGPTAAGRTVFGNLNIRNQNPKAEEIGRQQLGELMRAVGIAKVQDSDQLIGASCQIKIAVREASGGYDAQNEVKAYKCLNGSAPAPVAIVPVVAAAPAKAAPPWARK